MKKKNVAPKEVKAEDIVPFWDKMSGWDELSYELKLEYYWRYEYDSNGKRVFPSGRS